MGRATARERSAYRCAECGTDSPKWVGRCPECQVWGSVDEVGRAVGRTLASGRVSAPAVPINAVELAAATACTTGVPVLDQVLGGGLVPGAVVLLAGEPGVGKSTLLLEVAARHAEEGRTLIVTGEETAAQVRLRAERVGALHPRLYLAAETDLGAALSHVDAVRPSLLIVDSVQTIASAEVDGPPGGVTQVREVAAAIVRVAKERGVAAVLVGHVTKDGAVAGPRLLEHLVDVVLHFEGDRHSGLRMLRAEKNRYGTADEVGCFQLSDRGIVGLPDPSGLFISRRAEPVSGTCVTVTLEGRRALLAELQALLGKESSVPRRYTSGLDSARMAMVLAVLERRGGLKVGAHDVYAATVGGVRVTEPAADLALALSVASSVRNQPLPPGLVAVGELGLAGEVRRVASIGRRLAEAARLGFTSAIVPPDFGPVPAGMSVAAAPDLLSAIVAVGLSGGGRG